MDVWVECLVSGVWHRQKETSLTWQESTADDFVLSPRSNMLNYSYPKSIQNFPLS